jgi:hypothetical protein
MKNNGIKPGMQVQRKQHQVAGVFFPAVFFIHCYVTVFSEAVCPDVGESSHTVQEKADVGLQRMALNDNKAGMDNLDKERINKIIYEMSKGVLLTTLAS